MSGTIATVVYYGIKYINPSLVLPRGRPADRADRYRHRQFLDDGGHAGRSLRRHRQRDRRSPAITAGAVISGAYFGDKMTPLSETTILTPQIVGSNVYAHIRSMSKATDTSLPDLAGCSSS